MPGLNWKENFIERENRLGPAWHRLGTVFSRDEVWTLPDAARFINADYEVGVEEQVVVLDGVQYKTGKHMVVRKPYHDEPTPAFWGEVSSNWEPIQNMALVEMFSKSGEVFELETMGLLDEGAIFFFTLRDEPFDIRVNGKDDAHESYFANFNFFRPGESIIFCKGSTRVVCWNTMMRMLSTAKVLMPLTHHKGVNALAAFVAKAMQQRASMAKAERDALQMMATKPITAERAVEGFKAAWPIPQRPKLLVSMDSLKANLTDLIGGTTVPAIDENLDESTAKRIMRSEAIWEDTCNRMRERQELAMVSLLNMADNEGLGMNEYTMLQAVTETEQWRAGARGNVDRSAILGPGADAATRLVKWMGYGKREMVPVPVAVAAN